MTLKERRQASGLTSAEIARAAGISTVSLWQYETGGGYKPKYAVAKKLAELYGCTIDEIMEGCVEDG